MNRVDQKEFLTPLLNISDYLENSSDAFSIRKIQEDVTKTVCENWNDGEPLYGTTKISYDDLEAHADDLGVEPIDIYEWMCETVSKTSKDLEFHGKTISFKNLLKIFLEKKEQFIKYKESEDINNF